MMLDVCAASKKLDLILSFILIYLRYLITKYLTIILLEIFDKSPERYRIKQTKNENKTFFVLKF